MDDSSRGDGDHGALVDRHAPILRVFSAQQVDGAAMAHAGLQEARSAEDEKVNQPGPVFVVAVDYQSDKRIFPDVSNSLELARLSTFGLFVDGRVKTHSVESEADGNDMGPSAFIGGGEMGDAGGANEAQRASGQFQLFQSFKPFQSFKRRLSLSTSCLLPITV
jgi:hypothetical protein